MESKLAKVLLVLSALSCTTVDLQELAELEVILEFVEFDLEDHCIKRNDAEAGFLNGTLPDLNAFLTAETDLANFQRTEAENLKAHDGKNYGKAKLERMLDFFLHPGSALLTRQEFQEYRNYSAKLQVINARANITVNCKASRPGSDAFPETQDCQTMNVKKVEKFLKTENNEPLLRDTWTKWYQNLDEESKKTNDDYFGQLGILDLEAEQNGADDLASYWLKQSEITWVDYDSAFKIWEEILPLYQKLRQFIANGIVKKYGKDAQRNDKLIPSHLLGSLKTDNWLNAAEALGSLENSKTFQEIRSNLLSKSFKDLYVMADNFTTAIRLGSLAQSFYTKSQFNVTAPTCRNEVLNYCNREVGIRAIACSEDEVNLSQFLQVNEQVARLKHFAIADREELENSKNGFMFRDGPRESVIYEAISSASSVLALWPDGLRRMGFVPNTTTPHPDEETTSLLLSALYVLPSLPYYLLVDNWRINALRQSDLVTTTESDTETEAPSTMSGLFHDVEKREITTEEEEKEENNEEDEHNEEEKTTSLSLSNATESNQLVNATKVPVVVQTYDYQNVTSDWWDYRVKWQGISSPDGKAYKDFLQDERIIWHRSYISKFLGRIYLFQLLEHLKGLNQTEREHKVNMMLQLGKSTSWEEISRHILNITEVSAEPLLRYFKPLEKFLDEGAKFTAEGPTKKLHISSSSLNSTKDAQGAEGSEAVMYTLAAIAALGTIAVVVSIVRRRLRKKKKTEPHMNGNKRYDPVPTRSTNNHV